MQIAKDKVVTFEYTLSDADGQVLDSSKGRSPLAYLHGHGSIVPGLESALEGRGPGEELKVAVEPEQAYGQVDDNLIQAVPRERFEGIEKIEPGMQFTAQTEAGPRVITVVEVADQTVTVNANHPLAGMTLHFEVKVVDVRDATAEEVQHGHAHGPDGHHHHH